MKETAFPIGSLASILAIAALFVAMALDGCASTSVLSHTTIG